MRRYIPGIDWLKALGMIVILLGHLAGRYTNTLTPGIYPKQLGVAFFVFATGYSLANETRPSLQVVVNRLFEIFLWGLATAFAVSLVTAATHDTWALSNYLPFLLGVNVAFNHFPANPTTWYIGTYLHLLLVWCVLRRRTVTLRQIGAIALAEIGIRMLLAGSAGLFVAYMALPNWMTVLALGTWAGQRRWSPRIPVGLGVATALTLSVVWFLTAWPAIAHTTFPLMTFSVSSPVGRLAAMSVAVTVLYSGWTLLVVGTLWSVPAPLPVRFLARNTMFIFIAHMPVFFWMDPALVSLGWSYPVRCAIELTTCSVGLAAVSELLHRSLPLTRWRDSVRATLLREAAADAAASA